jgi:hypothetical protein
MKFQNTKQVRNGILLLKCLYLPKLAYQRIKLFKTSTSSRNQNNSCKICFTVERPLIRETVCLFPVQAEKKKFRTFVNFLRSLKQKIAVKQQDTFFHNRKQLVSWGLHTRMRITSRTVYDINKIEDNFELRHFFTYLGIISRAGLVPSPRNSAPHRRLGDYLFTYISYSLSDTTETNAVFCPTNWVQFRTSCYKPYWSNKEWDDALVYCGRVKGATLVSLDDKQEEDYVKNIMKSNGYDTFHMWPRTLLNSSKVGFMCEYELGEV